MRHGATIVTREFELEAVKLILERGVTVTQATRDSGVQAAPMGAGL